MLNIINNVTQAELGMQSIEMPARREDQRQNKAERGGSDRGQIDDDVLQSEAKQREEEKKAKKEKNEQTKTNNKTTEQQKQGLIQRKAS